MVKISQGVHERLKKLNPLELTKVDESCHNAVMRELGKQTAKLDNADELFGIWNANFPEKAYKLTHSSLVKALLINFSFGVPKLNNSLNFQNLAGSNPHSKEQALWLIGNGYRVLNSEGVSRVMSNGVMQAILDNDHNFFKSLGRLLAPPSQTPDYSIQLNPLKKRILYQWVTNPMELQFCVFTDDALAEFLKKIAPETGATFDGVRSTRKRLKLLRITPLLVKNVDYKNAFIMLS